MRTVLLAVFLLFSFIMAQDAEPDSTLINIDMMAGDSAAVVEELPVPESEQTVDVAAGDSLETIPQDSTFAIDADEEVLPESGAEEETETIAEEAPAAATEELAQENGESAEFQEIGPEPMELSYGYKGFRWGTPKGNTPRLKYADSILEEDSVTVKLSGQLGSDAVTFTYHFADSGFWKVEIDFQPTQDDVDAQISQFLRIEKSMAEIYGSPNTTNQLYSGPSPSYSGELDVNFSRAFYRSGWEPIPVRIELLLSGVVQHSGSDLPVFSGDLSVLKMVYYNPDYMHYLPASERTQKVPSIFDIY